MAKYNREFLVQYLSDLCALYIAERRVDSIRSEYSQKVWGMQNTASKLPPKPIKEKCMVSGGAGMCQRLIGTFLLGLSIFAISINILFAFLAWSHKVHLSYFLPISVFTWIFVAGMILFVFSVPIRMSVRKKDREYNKRLNERINEINEKYRIECEEYDRQCLEIAKRKEREISKVENRLHSWEREQKRIKNLIIRTYNANIIPSQYRDMYTVVYLYDYFSGSREDDLAMALNTYVLEQIKDRLDRIIENQSEMILNQYSIISNQHKSMEQRERHHAELCRKLDRMIATEEEHSAYLSMIESHGATMEFFATADYIRRI